MKFGKFYLWLTLILQLLANALIIPALLGYHEAVESFFWDLSVYFKSDLIIMWWWFAAVSILLISMLLASVHAVFNSAAKWWVRIVWVALIYLLSFLVVPLYCLLYLYKLKHSAVPTIAHRNSDTFA